MSDSNGFKGIGDIRALSALNLGCSIVAPLIVFIVGGLFLDQYFDTTPVLTLIGVGIGMSAVGLQLARLARIGGEKPGASARAPAPDSDNRSGGEPPDRDESVQ